MTGAFASDAELIGRFKNGDHEAFESLLEKYKNSLYGYLVRMIRDKTVASDLFQEVFVRFIKGVKNYDERGRFRSWLFTTANHLAVDYLRKSGERANFQSLDAPGTQFNSDKGFEGGGLLQAVKSPEPGPDGIAENMETKERLENAFAKLSPEQKQVFFLREYSGLSFKEIASMLNCPLGTVLARMSRAAGRLQKELNQNAS